MSIYTRVETSGKERERGSASFRRAGTEVKEDRQPANLTRPSRDFLVTLVVRLFPLVSFSFSSLFLPFSLSQIVFLAFFFVLACCVSLARFSPPAARFSFSRLSIIYTRFKVA